MYLLPKYILCYYYGGFFKLKLVKSLVISVLTYADVCLLGLSDRLNYKLQKIQNSCVRYVFNINRKSHIHPILYQHNLLNIHFTRILHTLTLLYSLLKFNEPKFLSNKIIFLSAYHNYNTRNDKLSITHSRTSLGASSFFIFSCKLWNELPPHIRNATSLSNFRENCKMFLLQEMYNKHIV